jgi:hypothetical protein
MFAYTCAQPVAEEARSLYKRSCLWFSVLYVNQARIIPLELRALIVPSNYSHYYSLLNWKGNTLIHRRTVRAGSKTRTDLDTQEQVQGTPGIVNCLRTRRKST